MKLNKLRGVWERVSGFVQRCWWILMLISAVLAIISGFISSNLYKTHTIIPICSRVENISQVNGSTVIKNYTTPGCSETFSLVAPIMKSAVTFLITLLLIPVLLAFYFIGVYGLVKKIEGMNPLGNKPHYELDYIVSSALSFLFFLGLFTTTFNVAPYFQVILTSFFSHLDTLHFLLLNASHAITIHTSLSPYFQLILTGVVISMSIITGYAWRITTPTPGTRWSDEVREIMRSVRNWTFFSYIVVLISLFFLWSFSSIEVSYKLSSLNGTLVLLVSASFSMIPIISFSFAIIITIMATAIYGLYFAKVLLDTINSQ